MRVTALEIALEYSQHPDSQVRANGCAVLAEIDDPAAVDRLGELAGLTREANPKVRAIALKALARQARHDEGAAGRLAASLGEEDDQSVLRQTLDSLRASDLPPARAAEALGKLLRPEVEERLRQRAVDELGEFGRHDAVALDLLMRAAREDESAAVRAAALRHVRAVVEARPSLVAELLSGDAADRHYSALSRLRREGLSWPVLRRPWLDRLRLARRARAEANNRDATVSPLVIQVPALIAAVAVPPMLWSMLGALADRSVRGASVNAYLLLATIAAVIVALLIPWLARPAGLAADRLAGAAAELLDLAPKTVVSGVALAIAALLFEAVLGSLTTLEAPQLRVLLVAVAGLPFLLFLVRSATLVAYGLVAAPAARFWGPAALGTLAGIGGALIAGAAAALVAGGGLEKAVFYGLFAALFAAPTSAAAAIGFARVDTTLTDACPIDTRRLRMGLATALSAPVVLGVAFLGAGSVMADLGLDGGDQYDSTPRQVDVALEEAVPFALAFPQRITLSRVELDTHGDLVLDLLSADGRVIKSADDPEKLEDFRLDEGEYAFRLRPYTSGGPPTEVQLAEVQLLPAIALIASTFSRGLRLDVQPSASQAQLPSEPDAKLVRVKFISNSLGFTKEEVDQARAAREMLSPGKSAASRPQAGGYALVRDNPQLAFVPGSLVRAVGGGASTDAQGQPYDLVLGWTRSGRRQVLRQEDIAPLDRPSADTLRQMEVFRRVYGEPGESRVETLLGRELTRKDPDRNLVASLERAGAWLAEPDKIEQNFDGNLFLYAGSPERAQVAPGSLLRGIRWKEGSDRVGFELIDGLGRDRGEYAHYWLPGEDAIHIGKTLEASWLDTARRFRDRYPVDASDARWKPVALADPAKLPPEPDDRTDGSFGPLLSADQIRSEAGAWIDEFGVDLASTEAPPMFTHYYIVADQEGTHDGYAGLGSIVQGVTWEGGDRDPLYRVLHGWTEGRNEYYIRARALTYLGPDWDEAWTDPAEELHARQENPATYHNFVDQVAP